MRRAGRGRSMLASHSVQQGNHCVREEFLYELKAGPAGGRLRRPSSRRQRRAGVRLHPTRPQTAPLALPIADFSFDTWLPSWRALVRAWLSF